MIMAGMLLWQAATLAVLVGGAIALVHVVRKVAGDR